MATYDKNAVAFVRSEMVGESAAPAGEVGVTGWVRKNLFSSIPNSILTIFGIYIAYLGISTIANFAFIHAVWSGESGAACQPPDAGEGACWPFISAYFKQFVYGRFTISERWRVDLVYLVGALGLIWLVYERSPKRSLAALLMLTAFPIFSLILLTGGNFDYSGPFLLTCVILTAVILGAAFVIPTLTKSNPVPTVIAVAVILLIIAFILFLCSVDFGLIEVETSLWGGLLMTLVIAVVGIVVSLPFGVVLALGRQSNMPIIRIICVVFIEFWRGVPLITVLFMASVMLPLFMPKGVQVDNLLRAMIGVAFFASAYMAEVVRGGLQALPKGQYEGAQALGLNYWKMMGLIILPQALKLVIPAIVSTFIGLFKDTTLVSIVGLFDLLGMVQSAGSDPKWTSPVSSHTAYLFLAVVFWVFCFSMSRYSIYMEKKLDTGHG
ncbi:MAG: amino acid ABC transporter permease [Hyphomicrobiales bacterium]|nr:amino acid ABC transporter permease [Hyphomicrobiales bacterium]